MARRGSRKAAGRDARTAPGLAGQPPFGPVRTRLAPASLLSEDEVEAIHAASLTVLEQTGIAIMSTRARALFRDAGADVDEADGRVRLAPGLVEQTIATCPSEWVLHARNPARNVRIGGRWIANCNATTPPYVSGPGLPRGPGSFDSFARAVRLCQSLNTMHFFYGYPVEPQDLPVETRHLDAYLTLATQSDKVWRAYALSDMDDAMEMARIARGVDAETFAAEPSLILNVNTNSPLVIDEPMCDGLIHAARHGQPVVISSVVMAGAMAPVTMAGALVEQNAECLAGMVLTQLAHAGAPVVYGSFTTSVSMRSGAMTMGTPEFVQAAIIGGQMARRYGVPYKSSGGNSSCAVDGQAAYESMNSLWGAYLGQANILAHGIGWLESGLTFSFEKAVMDAEMLSMMQAFLRPLDTSPEALAVDAIDRVGPGGHFFADPLTLERYETAFWEPGLSDWRPYGAFAEGGAKDATARAGEIALALLDTFEPPPMDQGIREELDAFVSRRKEEIANAGD